MKQPDPKPTDLMPTWTLVVLDLEKRGEHEVINDCVVRDQQGFDKYKCRLTPHNGRDSVQDAYEESMDLVVYLKNVIQELPPLVLPSEDFGHLSRIYHQAIGIMCALKDYKVNRDAEVAAFEEARKTHEKDWAFQKKVIVEPVSGPVYSERYPAPKKSDKVQPQESPVESIPVARDSDPSESHQAHTGHPEVFQGMLGVEVANQQPTVFIPPQIQGKLREDMEAWKANMEVSLEAERAKFLKNQEDMARAITGKPDRNDGKLHPEFGEYL